jgi:hypothetical protein
MQTNNILPIIANQYSLIPINIMNNLKTENEIFWCYDYEV